MSAALRHPGRAAAAAVLALAVVTAGAEAQTAGQNGGTLRGYQIPDQPKPMPPAPAAAPAAPQFDPGSGPPPLADLSPVPRFQDDPAPRFNLDPAPRTPGLDLRGGGAQCRTACADTRYLCRATDEPDVCDTAWGQCVANCAEASPSPP
jgi:hypothetical protein